MAMPLARAHDHSVGRCPSPDASDADTGRHWSSLAAANAKLRCAMASNAGAIAMAIASTLPAASTLSAVPSEMARDNAAVLRARGWEALASSRASEPAAAAAESTHARPDRPSSDCGASASGEAASGEAASLTKNLSSTSSVVLATVLVPSPHVSSSSGRQSSAATAESSQSQFEQITLAAGAGLLRGQH